VSLASPSRNKCPRCGLVSFAAQQTCRRCGTALSGGEGGETAQTGDDTGKRSIARRLIWILGATLLILLIWSLSLHITSDDLMYDQRNAVERAIAVLKQKGFAKQAFLLRYVTAFRRTDSWWNNYVGHQNAYAATNFPFEVVTLYPEFFEVSVDDNERAVLLLHESYHLFGSGEEAALEGVWRNKQRLDWSADKYGHSKVWKDTIELTMNKVPTLFQCGPDGHSDCTIAPD
jgi:hypothetical protein